MVDIGCFQSGQSLRLDMGPQNPGTVSKSIQKRNDQKLVWRWSPILGHTLPHPQWWELKNITELQSYILYIIFLYFSWCHQRKVVFSIVVRNFSTLALHKSPGENIISCKVYIIHGFCLVCFHPQRQPFHLQYKLDILVGHPLSFCFPRTPRTERSTRWCCCTNGFCRCWCPIWKSLQTALGSRTRNRWSKSR